MEALKTTKKQKQHTGLGVSMALEIIEQGKRPMSPAQIQAKYALTFPFTVKRVVEAATHIRCPHKATGKVGEVLTFYRLSAISSYIYTECCSCHVWEPPADGLGIDHDSERFVWVGAQDGGN